MIQRGEPLKQLIDHLREQGLFRLNIEQHEFVDTDGESISLHLNRASKIHMWPMGTNYWVRDNAIIGARLMALENPQSFGNNLREIGKELLLSAVSVMSSCSQLERFDSIIDQPELRTNPHAWPHIFLSIYDNLSAQRDEPWMHMQDAWQIACYYLLDAVEQGYISVLDLSEKHRKLLDRVVPFLKAVEYPYCENGGSWEEVAAVRSSVVAWETALLKKLEQCQWGDFPGAPELAHLGEAYLAKALPFEAPLQELSDPRYREADAALIYILQLRHELSTVGPEQARAVLEQLDRLHGDSGIRRYLGDSYQGLSYYTNEIASKLSALYETPSGDSSGVDDFVKRGKIVPSCHEAEWTHFVWQLCRYHKDEGNLEQAEMYLHFGLSLITGARELSVREGEGLMEVFEMPAYQMPECYNSELYDGELFQYASMHTPLYWSVAESMAALDSMIE